MKPDANCNLGIARTFQNIELFENMTVLDNILIGAHRRLDYGPISGLFLLKKQEKLNKKQEKLQKILLIFLKLNNTDILT